MVEISIKSCSMPEEMKEYALSVAQEAFKNYPVEKDIAGDIKKKFDEKYDKTWHCIVGKSFGSYVTHEAERFIYFYVDKNAVLLFKVG